jgi:nucleoside-diphosphate-sugar epimerase
VARVLLVGGGCRARALATELAAAGHAVRATTRDPARMEQIRTAGAEPYVGDPDRIATLMDGLAGVTIVAWLMGTATGDPERVFALHDTRLRMLWEKLVDTPVRGVVYEAAGSVAPEALVRGEAVARVAHETWRIPLAYVREDPADVTAWVADARRAVDELLGL